MAFYHGRGTAFWQPSPEAAKELAVDALSSFPSEPSQPGRPGPASPHAPDVPPPGIDLHELQGLALHLDQTCGRIEELAQRTEGLLRQVERLSATAAKGLKPAVRLRHPLRIDVADRWTHIKEVVDERRDQTKQELQAKALVARGLLNRHVRRPMRDAAAWWRKRVAIARVSSEIEFEQLATNVLHAAAIRTVPIRAAASPVKIVIRHPPLRAPERPAVVSASSGMMFAALVSGLVLVAAAPRLAPVVPTLPGGALPQVTRASVLVPVPNVWSALLGPTPAAPTSAASIPAPSTPAAVVAPAPTIASNSRDYLGTLTVESEPAGAAVFINQQFVGQTPVTLSDLRAGSRAVWVQSDGYQRWSAGVLVPADKETRLNVKLQRDQR
jgi:PEGA domain-containing protein